MDSFSHGEITCLKEGAEISDATDELYSEDSEVSEDIIGEHSDHINKEGDKLGNATILAKKGHFLETKPDGRSANMVAMKRRRAPRYFDTQYSSWFVCYKRGTVHICRKCNKGPKWKPCYICGDFGHGGKCCKKVNNCFICSKKGHLALDCPNNKLEEDHTNALCLKCGITGHRMSSCTNDYDPEDLKDIQCYICKAFGHLCCSGDKIEEPTQVSCYNCGESTHYGSECPKLDKVAGVLQPVLPSSETKDLDSETTIAETAVGKDAEAAKPVTSKSRRRKKKKKNPIGPSMDMTRCKTPILGPHCGRPGPNVWLSPAATNGLNNSNQSSYQNTLPNTNQQVATQITGQPQNHQTGVQIPHQNFDHQTDQVPQRFVSNQTQSELLHRFLNPEMASYVCQQLGLPQRVSNHQTSASILRNQNQNCTPAQLNPNMPIESLENNPNNEK